MNLFNKHSNFYILCLLIVFSFIFFNKPGDPSLAKTSLGIFFFSFVAFKSHLYFAKKNGWGQSVRKEGLKTHLQKEGTPTAAGWVFFVFLSLVIYIYAPTLFLNEKNTIICILSTFVMFCLGALDDYQKIKGKKEGLLARYRLAGQFFVGSLLGYYLLPWDLYTNIIVGFLLFGTAVNGINFTDGSDGLLAAVILATPIGILTLYQTAPLLGFSFEKILNNTNYLFLFLALLMLAWIPFNKYPAKLFMGETGSYSLGALIGFIAIYSVTLNPSITFIILAIPAFQIGTVVLQVFSYKKFGKRIFLMAPFHHHLEKKGWTENKIAYSAFFAQLTLTVSALMRVNPS